jgi:hypothetical protein
MKPTLFFLQMFTLVCIIASGVFHTIVVWYNRKVFRAYGEVMKLMNKRITRLEGICGLSAEEWQEATKDFPDAWFRALFTNTPEDSRDGR